MLNSDWAQLRGQKTQHNVDVPTARNSLEISKIMKSEQFTLGKA
jgi:hypothetical protein